MATRSVFDEELTTFAGRRLAVTVPDEWVTISDVKARLDLTHSLAVQLMISELAGALAAGETSDGGTRPWVIRSGSKLLMPAEGLERLAEVPETVRGVPAYINVRLGPGTIDEQPGEREVLGFHRQFTPAQAYAAATYWWPFNRADEWIGRPFVASMAGFVTLCGRITGVFDHPQRDVVGFHVETADDEVNRVFRSRRIPIHRGGPVLKVRR